MRLTVNINIHCHVELTLRVERITVSISNPAA
jgi:hypothetical protein